ncbi:MULTISPECIES: pyridoxamine 5'-phosphate oxidase family protein [unclassified Leucobacter]|uniref:pyridoxamine 5'-phosphate oxidase family protein n=1 Tax=unclassified Leucobacter TaxID=2621730 RepID=UPI001F12B960|nr:MULTISPECIES: pyridoxamine 5'-phosphate oxidase family protein [unclassified Leucobacter]
MTQAPSSPNLQPQRMPELMSRDRGALDQLLSDTVLAHVGLSVDGRPMVMPTAFAVQDDKLLIHGSTGSRWMRAVQEQDACVTITRLNGVLVARSMFESSIHYQSAVFFGRFTRVEPERLDAALVQLTDRILPGRSEELRGNSRKELAATLLLEMPITDWSLRISDGWAEDDDRDVAGDAWGGVIRLAPQRATAEAAPDLRAGIAVPPSVAAFVGNPRGIV